MAITSGYFNSVNGDRKYNADQMSEYFEGIINEGVCQHIDGGLAVTAGTGLSVNVAAGKAFIGKKWIRNDASLTLTISAASASYARIDAVVLRRNNTTRTCQIVVKSGTPAASPAAPTMTRNSTTYEMALAYVNVAANATSVTVTDKRADTTVCGWATVAQETSGEVDAMLNAMKTGFDGVEYPTPAAMVQGCDNILSDRIGTESDNLNVLKLRVNSYFPEFIVGGIDVNNGEFRPADVNRAHTDLISTKGCSIYVPISWGVYLVYYSNDGEYAGSSGGWETGVVTPNTAYEAFRILIRSTDLVTDFTGIPNGGIIEVVNNDVNIKDDVDALKSKLNMNYCDIYPNAINVSNGRVEPNNNTRAITGFIPYKYNFVYANSGYSYYIVCYNADLSYKSATGWKTGNAAVPSCAFYRLLIKNDSISDWTGIKNDFISIYNSETVTFRNKIIIGTGGDYTSFSEGIIAAFNLGNCDVYVNTGTYNIKTEMESLYGANVWTSDYDSNPYKRGLPWGNGMRIIGSPGVVLQMDASGISNTDVWAEFSVLMNYSGAADDQKVNSVEGIKFNCTCIRYCIHLDLGAYEMDDTYIMDSCSFYLDNSENTTKTFAYCVGMGASINTTYKITNCYVYGITPPNPRDTAYLYFHHTNATSPNDKMIFEGNYIDNGGTIRIDEYGDSQNKCLVLVSNNSLGSALMPPENPTDNLKVCAWNNEVRTS